MQTGAYGGRDNRVFSFLLALFGLHYIDPVVFVSDELRPTPKSCDSISFGCGPYDEDMLSTAASDSEELVSDLCNYLPPSGQEKHTSPSYSELLDVVNPLGSEVILGP